MDLMILREAEQESMEIFYAMRKELRFYLKRTQLLETISFLCPLIWSLSYLVHTVSICRCFIILRQRRTIHG